MSVNGYVMRIKFPNNNEALRLLLKRHVETRINKCQSDKKKLTQFYWNIPNRYINIYMKSTPPPRFTYFESFLGVPVHTHVTRHFLAPPCSCLRLRGNKKEANHQVVQLSGSDYRDLHTCWNNIYIYVWKYNNRKTILLKEISDRFFMSQCLTVWILH